MKQSLSIATGLRRLSSERPGESPFPNGDTSPHIKTGQYLKNSYGELQGKKHLSSSLKGLLSPVDYKLVEMQTKANALRLESESLKLSPKGSARLSGQIGVHGADQPGDPYLRGLLHQKKQSYDSRVDSQYEDTLGSKTKVPNTNSISHNRSQTSSNIYLKDVEYIVNPMFSPVNGPPKYITHRQNESLGESTSSKGNQFKKIAGIQDNKAIQKSQENQELMLKKESHSAKMTPKASFNQFFDTKKEIMDQRLEEGSSDELRPGSRAKTGKESNLQISTKLKDGKKSPSINISPRVEAYNSANSYSGANNLKQASQKLKEDFETFQIAKSKSTMGSLYSRQREENQEQIKVLSNKSSPKKSSSKGVKKDSLFSKSKSIVGLNNQNKSKKGEIYIKENQDDVQLRPRSSKHSEPNIQKDIIAVFSGFNNQLKRNSAAQIYNPNNQFESNLQSTRSAVDKTEKYFSRGDVVCKTSKSSGQGVKPSSVAEIESKLTSEGNADDVFVLASKEGLNQFTNNPNAKVLLLRKQAQEKRANRGFKSADQNMFESHYYPAELLEKKEILTSSTKQGSYYLPDTTHTSAKLQGNPQLNDVFLKVNKILDAYQRKERTWEEEKQLLLAEIHMLRSGKYSK